MQGTTVMHYNLNGEELEEYTLLAKTFQARAGRRFLLRVPQFLKPPLPIVKTGYETKFNILKESNTTSDSHACPPVPTVIGDKSSFTDQNLCGLRRENSSGKLTEWTPTQEGGGKGLSSKSLESESTCFKRPRKGSDNKDDFSKTDFLRESPKNESEGEVLYNRYIHSLYFFGSGLGDEVFYLTVFPFLFWNWDEYVMRRLVLLWVFSMYIGQGLKDVLRWPRPPSPPVIVMETKYESEYGMPSTHAIVGSIVPFSLVYFSYGRYEFPWQAGFAFFVFWCGLVCLSRIYMGVHSFQDIVGGLCVSFMIISISLPFITEGAEQILVHPYAGLYIILASIAMIFMYPSCDKWTRARGDTTRILCGGTGAMVSAWVTFYIEQAPIPDPFDGAPFALGLPSLSSAIPMIGNFFATFLVGVLIIFPVKLVFAFITKKALGILVPNSQESLNKKLFVELTYIFITYTVVGFAAIYIAPKSFIYLGLK